MNKSNSQSSGTKAGSKKNRTAEPILESPEEYALEDLIATDSNASLAPQGKSQRATVILNFNVKDNYINKKK